MKKNRIWRYGLETGALMACVLIWMLLAGCSQKEEPAPEPAAFDPQEPLTICFDLDSTFDPRHYSFSSDGSSKYTGAKQRREAVEQVLEAIKAQGGPENVQVEYIEGVSEDRDSQITRLRAELMAGAGPDLFVVRQAGDGRDLFKFPEKKMEDGLFLTLDRYLETARFMEPDRMVQPIWDAGKNAKGQQVLLPMTYDLSGVAMRAADVELDPEKDYTLFDMLSGGKPCLAGALAQKIDAETGALGWNIYPAFGQLADYQKEELSFTQEELGEALEGLLAFNQKVNKGELGDLPGGVNLGNLVDLPSEIQRKSWRGDDVALVPLYGREGGVTARVVHFAGVNANAENPAGAFWAADFLLDQEVMQSSDFGTYLWCRALPVCGDLLQEDKPLTYQKDGKDPENSMLFRFDPKEWRAFTALRDQITDAEYPTVLDGTLAQAYYTMFKAADEPARKKVITETYSQLKMLLGES